MKSILNLIPQGGPTKTALHNLIQLALLLDATVARSEGNVVIDGFVERIRLLPYHSDLLTQLDDVGRRIVQILPVHPDMPFGMRRGNFVVHPVK
ncbi:hypothetical protein D1872_299750 [compost metagenome]